MNEKQDPDVPFSSLTFVSNFNFDSHYLFEPTMKSYSTNDNTAVILTEHPLPMVGKQPFKLFTAFGDKTKCIEPSTAAAISPNGAYMSLGHENGSVTILNGNTGDVIKEIPKPVTDASEIRYITFSQDSTSFLCVNNLGQITQYTISNTLGLYQYKSKKIYDEKEPAVWAFSLFASGSLNIIATNHTCHVYNAITGNSIPLFISDAAEPIQCNAMVIDETIQVVVTTSKTIHAFSVEFDALSTPLFVKEFTESTISKFVLFDNGMTALIFENDTMVIISSKGTIVRTINSPDIALALRETFIIFQIQQVLYFVNTKFMYCLQFITWRQLITFYYEKKNYQMCMEIALNVYKGADRMYFDVPWSARQRSKECREVIAPILGEALEHSTSDDERFDILIHASRFGLVGFICSDAISIMQKRKLKTEFFYLLFSRLTEFIHPVLTMDVLLSFLGIFSAADRKDEAQQLVLKHPQILEKYAHEVTLYEYLVMYEMTDLLIYLWTKVYHDYLSPLIYLSHRLEEEIEEPGEWTPKDRNQLYPFVERVFLEKNFADYHEQRVVLMWLCADFDGDYPRWPPIFRYDHRDVNKHNRSNEIVNSIFLLLPVCLRDNIIMKDVDFIDVILRGIAQCHYHLVEPIINVIIRVMLQPTVQPNVLNIPYQSFNHLLHYIFKSEYSVTIRENLLTFMNEKYSSLIVLENYIRFCRICGFSNIVRKLCLQKKPPDYSAIIQTMMMAPDRRRNSFPLIKEKMSDSTNMKNAIREHFKALVLVDPQLAVAFLNVLMPEFHNIFMSDNNATYDFVRFKYMEAISENQEWTQQYLANNDKEQARFFKLVCQFNPNEALKLLKSGKIIELEDQNPTGEDNTSVLQICKENHVIEACIHIYSLYSQVDLAVKLLGQEVRRQLVDVIDTHAPKKGIYLPSIDRIATETKIAKPYQTIQMTLDLLSKSPEKGPQAEKMWLSVFKGFILPLWLVKKDKNKNVAQAITLFFAFFVIEVIPRSNPDFVLEVLRRDFSFLNTEQSRHVFATVFRYLNYQHLLANNVEELLLEDCMKLRKEMVFSMAHGNALFHLRCARCKQEITGTGGVGVRVFDCGHCYHNTLECCPSHMCPECHNIAIDVDRKLMGTRRKTTRGNYVALRQLERVEMCLRPTYGKGADESQRGNAVFYVPPVAAKNPTKISFDIDCTAPDVQEAMLEL